MPVFLIEFRPLQTLFALFSLSILFGARHGDPRGVAIAAVYFGVLYWRTVLDAARWAREVAYEVNLFVTWAWCRLFG